MRVDLYTDGGNLSANPSKEGGTWAWVLINPELDIEVNHQSGVITPAGYGLETISNNVSELYAAICGLEAVNEHYLNTWFTDSKVTLLRITIAKTPFNGVPLQLVERVRAIQKRFSGGIKSMLLGGHPSQAELAAGVRKDGFPVSKWNCMCDRLCNEQRSKFFQNRVVM